MDDPPDLGSSNVWNNLRSRISDHVAVGKHDIEILIRRKEMYMTFGEVVKRYDEIAKDLAKAVNEIVEVRETAAFLTEATQDNGDPKYKLDEALTKLAGALAITIEYGKEYAEDAKKWGEDAPAFDPNRED